MKQQLACLQISVGNGRQRLFLAVRRHFIWKRGRPVAAAAHAARREVAAVGDVEGAHLVVLRAVGDAEAGRAAAAASPFRVGAGADLGDADRVLLLVDLDAVAEHQAVGDRVAVGYPAVDFRSGRAALRAEELLVDVRIIVLAPVVAGDNREARPDAARSLGQPIAVPGVGEGLLRRDHQPLADVRRRHRAGVGEARDTDHAVLAQPHVDAAEGAGVVRDVGVDAVEDPGHDVVHGAGARFVDSRRHAVDVIGQVDVDHRRLGVDAHLHVDRDAVRQRPEGVVPAVAGDRPLRHLRDDVRHPPLGVVEPLLDELLHRLDAVLGDEVLQPALADAGRANHRQVIAVPLVRHADAAAAHTDDVADVGVVTLHADGGEDDPPFLVDVAGEGHVGGWVGVAAVGLMRLGGGGEEVLAIDEDGDQDDMICRVGVAEVGIVMEEGVALADIVMQIGDRLGQKLHADDVHRQPLGGSEEAVVAGDERAGEVARHVEHRRAPGAQQRVLHLAHDGVEAVGDDRQQNRIERHQALTSSRSASATANASASVPISSR